MNRAGRRAIADPPIPVVAAPDSQRSRVYEAEALVRRIFDRAGQFPMVQVAGSTITIPMERKFGSVASVQTYLDLLGALPWVRQRWPAATRPVLVRARAGQQRAHYEPVGAVVALPTPARGLSWAMRELVVLHEYAHHLGPSIWNGRPAQSLDNEIERPADQAGPGPRDRAQPSGAPAYHGPEFTERLVELVSGVIAPEAALLLRVTMSESGIEVGRMK